MSRNWIKLKSDHGTWGFQKASFEAYNIHYHGPKGFAMGKAKEVLSMQMDHDKEMPVLGNVNGSKKIAKYFHDFEEGRKGEGRTWRKSPPKMPFWHVLKKPTYPNFWFMVISLG